MQSTLPAGWPFAAPGRQMLPARAAAGIGDGCWLPDDLQGAEIRRKPFPCIFARELHAAERRMTITNADTGAVVYDDEKGGWL